MRRNNTATVQSGQDSYLNERAMLVRLSISFWPGKRTDERITREIAKQYKGNKNMGKYTKNLIDPDVLKPGEDIAREAANNHKNLTLPWMDDGFRLLNSMAYMQYTQTMRLIEDAFWQWAKGVFIPNYPDHVKKAESILNGNWRAEDYPSVTQIANKFGFRLNIGPVPNYGDWRVQNISEADIERLKAEGKSQLQEQLKTSSQDILLRLQKVIAAMIERLNAYTVNSKGKVEHSFHDTLVTNISDVLDVVPLLNITNDPAITTFCDQIEEQLTKYHPDKLRADEKVRKDVAKRAEEIMAKMGSFLS